jgi:hypothetical protein
MAIDRSRAINDLSKIKVKGNEEGLIPGFGVLVNQFPAKLWNLFSAKILQAAGNDLYDDAAGLLENAAAECGYHTGWGIINSEEFKAVIGPMIEKMPEDVLHGAYAVFTAWGWANAEIMELIPNEKMVVRAYDYYESDVKKVFTPRLPFAYMVTGVSRAFMDIAYGDKPYPDGFGKFQCVQTKAIELGDDYGEFVVTKS